MPYIWVNYCFCVTQNIYNIIKRVKHFGYFYKWMQCANLLTIWPPLMDFWNFYTETHKHQATAAAGFSGIINTTTSAKASDQINSPLGFLFHCYFFEWNLLNSIFKRNRKKMQKEAFFDNFYNFGLFPLEFLAMYILWS